MKHQIPGPILSRIIKLTACGVCITGAGLIWSIASKDRTTVMLTMAVTVAFIAKVAALYHISRDAAYDIFEGTVLSSTMIPLRKKQEVLLQQEGGAVSILLQGRTKFTPGVAYRIYTEKQHEALADVNVPQALMPGRSLLGFERME